MATTKTADEIVTTIRSLEEAIKGLDEEQRENLRLQMAKIDEMMEDLEDMLAVLRSEGETERPFDEFVHEFESRNQDV